MDDHYFNFSIQTLEQVILTLSTSQRKPLIELISFEIQTDSGFDLSRRFSVDSTQRRNFCQ